MVTDLVNELLRLLGERSYADLLKEHTPPPPAQPTEPQGKSPAGIPDPCGAASYGWVHRCDLPKGHAGHHQAFTDSGAVTWPYTVMPSPPAFEEGAASVAPPNAATPFRLALERLDLLERESVDLRTGEPGGTIGKLQDELRAARYEIKAEEVIREALTERLEEQNARLARLDALLASEEPPEGLVEAVYDGRIYRITMNYDRRAWRWFREQLGKPPAPPLDSVEREIAAAEEAGGAP